MRVDFDIASLRSALDDLGPGKFNAALKRALSRTATSARATMIKLVSDDMALTQTKVRAATAILPKGKLTTQVEAKGKRIPLIDFGARGPEPSKGKGHGVSYRLPSGRSTAPHAFITTTPIRGRGVFERLPGSIHHKRPDGQRTEWPIRQLYGPSIVNVFKKYLPDGAARANEVLKDNIAHEIKFALSRR